MYKIDVLNIVSRKTALFGGAGEGEGEYFNLWLLQMADNLLLADLAFALPTTLAESSIRKSASRPTRQRFSGGQTGDQASQHGSSFIPRLRLLLLCPWRPAGGECSLRPHCFHDTLDVTQYGFFVERSFRLVSDFSVRVSGRESHLIWRNEDLPFNRTAQ